MALVLFNEQPKAETSVSLLEPLKNGKAVVMSVDDKRLPRKKRSLGNPLLVIVPSEMLGAAPGKLIVSLTAYGSEIIDIATELKMVSFYRLGLNATLSSALAEALKKLYRS